MSESKIQSDFHVWLHNSYPELRGVCYHIPNGGTRGKIEAYRFKSMGVLAGVPDYHIAISRGKYYSIYIEFKAPGEKARLEQIAIHEKLRAAGNMVIVVDTLQDAQEQFKNYYKL